MSEKQNKLTVFLNKDHFIKRFIKAINKAKLSFLGQCIQ